jgi:hypothetical protein
MEFKPKRRLSRQDCTDLPQPFQTHPWVIRHSRQDRQLPYLPIHVYCRLTIEICVARVTHNLYGF